MIYKVGVFFALIFAFGVFALTIKPKDDLSIYPIDPASISGEYDASDQNGQYLGQVFPSQEITTKDKRVLGSNNSNKRIEVDLSAQRLYAFENDKKVYDFLISSGKWGRTPTGTFTIWGKFRYTKMEGGKQSPKHLLLPT